MLHSCKEYELSLSYLEHSLQLNLKYTDLLYQLCIDAMYSISTAGTMVMAAYKWH